MTFQNRFMISICCFEFICHLELGICDLGFGFCTNKIQSFNELIFKNWKIDLLKIV